MFATLDLADEDDMIAFFIAAAIEAFKGGDSASQQGCAAEPVDEFNVCPSILALAGKTFSQFFLIGGQDVDRLV